jgi:D-glycero-beta-D-manno-heptose-7-phosphate kinase
MSESIGRISTARLGEVLQRLSGVRVLVLADLILDEFRYGEPSRVSREAPVLILNYDSTEVVPGGAGNAAANAAALGGVVRAIGQTGRDETGRRLLHELKQRKVDAARVIRPASYRTPTKTRILAGGIHSAKQQVVRIDRASSSATDERTRAAFEARVLRAIGRADALLISDYGCGLVTPALLAKAKRRKNGIAVVDSRYALTHFRGMTACTPNESEVEQALGLRIGDDPKALERAGRELLKQTRAKAVLVTRGSRGMALFEPGEATVHIPIVGSDQISDVTGAGDTVIATLTRARRSSRPLTSPTTPAGSSS